MSDAFSTEKDGEDNKNFHTSKKLRTDNDPRPLRPSVRSMTLPNLPDLSNFSFSGAVTGNLNSRRPSVPNVSTVNARKRTLLNSLRTSAPPSVSNTPLPTPLIPTGEEKILSLPESEERYPVKMPEKMKDVTGYFSWHDGNKNASGVMGEGGNGYVVSVHFAGYPADTFVAKVMKLNSATKPAGAEVDAFKKEIDINAQMVARLKEKYPGKEEEELFSLYKNILLAHGSAYIHHPPVAASSDSADAGVSFKSDIFAESEGELALIMRCIKGFESKDNPSAKPGLKVRINQLYENYLNGETEKGDFISEFKRLIKGALTGTVQGEELGFINGDLNVDNLMFDAKTNESVVGDFGHAGKDGEYKGRGLLEITPPERLMACDPPDDKQELDAWLKTNAAHNAPLSDKTAPYALGQSLLHLVFGNYQPWTGRPFAEEETSDQRFNMLMESIASFEQKGELFSEEDAIEMMHLRSKNNTDQHVREADLRTGLKDAGFFDLVKQLTHPVPEERLSIKSALESHPFLTN